MELNKIHHCDCLEFMRAVPDNYFDLVLTDPPYGLNIHNKNITRGGVTISKDYGIIEWDKTIPSKEVFKEICRVSKQQIIFGGNYFVESLSNSSCWLVWDKNNGDSSFADCELAWTNYKTAVRLYKYTWSGMLQGDMRNKEERYHPTQKPVRLFTAILQDYAKAGFKVFDPFMGSGTTALACKSLDLDWCGCEREIQYVEVINKRLKAVQCDLFGVD